MSRDYTLDYRAMGLSPDADWPEIRSRYRTLIKQWHPDRFGHDPERRKLAEEKTKELTRAYHALEQHYQRHGVPPRVVTRSPDSISAPRDATPFQSETTETIAPNAPSPRRRLAIAAALLGVVGFITYLAPSTHAPAPRAKPDVEPILPPDENAFTDTSVNSIDDRPRFSIGATPGEVFSAQGIPTRIDGGVWRYDKSTVHFERGTVSHWNEHPDSPLRVTLADSFTRTAFFTHGSTRAEVRDIQGRPSRETPNTWEYGGSRVFFKADRVTGWEEAPLYPLKTAK